jgi:uncharacterized protein (TIGR02246 family)
VSLTAAESLEIMQLVTRADACATARDANGYVELFTEDGVMEGDMGRASGREALAAAVARVWANEPPGTLHLTCNAVVDDAASTPAVASVLVMLMPRPSGVAIQAADVIQHFLLTPAGWRISSRQITKTLTGESGASIGR